jgi:hypothetical protein
MAAPVHMIGYDPRTLKIDAEEKTRCGLVGVVTAREQPSYHLINERGGNFKATTRTDFVTCQKCRNLLDFGAIHARKVA